MKKENIDIEQNIKNKKVIEVFDPVFFWDVNTSLLSFNKHKNYIIERVLARSFDLEIDLKNLDKIYSQKDIIKLATSTYQIFGNNQIERIAKYYKISPKRFKRYIIV